MTTVLREAPAAPPLRSGPDAAHPDLRAAGAHPEPRLAVEQIQGNILPGFLKDHQTMLFLRIVDPAACRRWLRALVPQIATADEVLAFNRLFKAIRRRRGRESGTVKATWTNIAFSAAGLRRLGAPVDDFADAAFKAGLAARAVRAGAVAGLGDPAESTKEGNPHRWLIGGPDNEADIVLIVASDDQDDLLAQVEAIEDSIYAFRVAGAPAASGVAVIFKQHGANLPGSLSGHEHFGFLDGVSQPGIRGHVSDDPTDVLTPRQNPRDPDQGKPGQDLLWPGEFVFGYPGQDASKPIAEPSDAPIAAGTPWADNGSFLVFRRLRQDVGAFHRFLHDEAAAHHHDPLLLGAKLVGRWPSGAPILRAPGGDNADLGRNDCANNDFEFFDPDPSLETPAGDPPPDHIPPLASGDGQCAAPGLFPPSRGDRAGAICPFGGHIRKSYPRNDLTPAGTSPDPDTRADESEQDTQTHRLLRRGIPFGPASSSTPAAPLADDADRGLLFLAYQTSIEDQFEFVTQKWVNNPNFSTQGAGHDPIIGQNDAPGAARRRTFSVTFDTAHGHYHQETLTTHTDWVVPTGGGYFFAPSITALETLAPA